MIKVENNTVSIGGISIQFESNERANSFLFDYISKVGKHEQQENNVLAVEVPTYTIDEDILIDYDEKGELIRNYGAIEIENLDLSIRAYNCLKRAGINTVKEVLLLDCNQAMRIRNLGRRSLIEVEERVNEFVRCNHIRWTEQINEGSVYYEQH